MLLFLRSVAYLSVLRDNPLLMISDEEIDRMQIKLSYLEEQNEELCGVVAEQDKRISALMVQVKALEDKIKDLIEESGEERANRKPPHY